MAVTALCLWASAQVATGALSQQVVQQFFVPFPETDFKTSLQGIAGSTSVGTNLQTTLSIVVGTTNTIIVYDHWEDGYENDLNSPTQPNTQIWGDGILTNGVAPGYTNDFLPPGAVITLTNLVTLPRNPSVLRYDGRDRIGATRPVTLTRAGWSTAIGTLLASSAEVYDISRFGTSFLIPVGTNTTPSVESFSYSSLHIVASQNGTVAKVDKNGDGLNDLTNTLNMGESLFIDGGVNAGATVSATKPIQVHELTGRINSSYQSRTFAIRPVEQWDTTYYAPVGTTTANNAHNVFLFNQYATNLTVLYSTRTATNSVTVPPKGNYKFAMPLNSGAKFYTTNNGRFYAVGCNDSGSSTAGNNQNFDWGYALLPAAALTPVVIVGWAPGSDDQNGTPGPDQNGSPVWVTPTKATTIYVNYAGNYDIGPLVAPNGHRYNTNYSLVAYQFQTIFNPTTRNMTGARIFTSDGTTFAAAWGEDANVATQGAPYLDAGTGIIPFPVPNIAKTSAMAVDQDGNGKLSWGDTLEYTIRVQNDGMLVLGNVLVLDALPSSLLYVTNSTTVNGTPVADNPVPPATSAFPLDEAGLILPQIQVSGFSDIKYRVTVAPGSTGISNSVLASAGGTVGTGDDTVQSTESVVAAPPVFIDFTDASGNPVSAYLINSGIYLTLTDLARNTNSTSAQTISVQVTNITNGDRELVTLTETGTNSGIFRNTTPLPSSISTGSGVTNGTLLALAGHNLTAAYTDPVTANSDSATATIAAAPLPAVSKRSTLLIDQNTDGRIGWGDTVSYSIVLTNASGFAISNLVVRDTLPTNVTYVSSSTTSNGVSVADSGTTPFPLDEAGFQISTLPSASARTLSFQVVVTAGTVISNSVTATNAAGQVQAQDIATVLPPPPTCNLNFSDSVGNTLPLSQENAGIYATLVDTSKNTDSTTLQTATVTVTNLSTGDAESLVLTETGTNTGVFRNSAALPSATLGGTSQGDGTLHTRSGDMISVLFAGPSSETCSGLATVIPAIQIKKLYLNADNAGDAYQNLDRIDPVAAGKTFTSNSIALANGGSTTFAQTPTFCSPFFLPAGSTVAITNYFSVASGVMPTAPTISATLKKGTNAASATNILSLTNPSTNSGSLRWTATLPASITVNSGEKIFLVVTSAQSGVTFNLQYNSSSKPSVVALPTTTVITLDQFGVYDAAYPGGTLITNAVSGQTVYFRGTASDPFGSYDVTSLALSILNPGGFTFATNLNAANVVTTNPCSKTFEYVWIAENWQGSHTIRATAYEGTEGITNSAQTSLQVSYPAGGTPSTTTFIDSTGTVTNSYATNQSICMRVTDLNRNLNPATVETITVLLTSTTGDSETVTLSETATNSGVFSGCVNANTNNASVGNGIINAAGGAGLTVTYTDPTNPSDTSSDTAIVRTPPGPRPTVNIFKTLITPANGNVLLGSTVQFDITVGNPGSVTVTNVTLTDVFPSSRLQFTSATLSPDNTTPTGTLTWNNLGPLASGQSVTISTFFRAIAAGALTNSASVTGTTNAGPALATALNTAPGIAVSKTLVSPNPGPAYINSNVVFRIAITNIGSTTINSYILQDQFSSACFQFLGATTTPSGSGGGLILWTGLGSLAPGASTVIFVTNKVTGTCSPALNTATISSAVDQNGTSVPSVQSSASIMNVGATMSGTVWYDANADATNDTGDSALSAVIVYADVNNNGIREGSEPFANTDTNGFYQITSLPAGIYTARVDTNSLLSGVRPTYDFDGTNTPHTVTLTVTNGQTLTGLDFGYIGSGSIGGYAWNDLNANGTKGATEPFLANLVLFLDYNGNGARDGNEPSLTTGPSGTYIFSNLVADSYRVAVDLASLPSGLRETYDLDGTNTLHVSTVLLAAGRLVTNANFGYQGAASLSGVITDTLTGLPIPGVTVVVVDSLGATQTVTSDGTGNYSIPALWTGPAAITANRVGYAGASSSPTIVTGVNTQNLALTPNILTGVIRDSVTTLPIGGATVTVVDSANVTNIILTGTGGTYVVTNISTGAATVTARKTGYTSTSASPAIVIGANTQDLNLTPNTLAGQVTDSSTGLPISGATVTVTDSSNVVHTVSTDGTGHYSVSNLPTGPTTVLAGKTGYSSTTATPTIVPGGNTQNAVLTPNILTGVIRDSATTLPIVGATVTVIDNASITNIIVTGAGGTYGVTNIASGNATVNATKSGYSVAATNLTVVVGANIQNLNLIPNSLIGQVTDSSTGLPINGATVSITDSSNVVHTVSTDGTGHYSVANLPTGPTTVVASKTGYSSATSTPTIVSGNNTQNAVLTPNVLTGVIRDGSTILPIAGAVVTVIDNTGATNVIITGAGGTYTVTNIAIGSATVSASKSGYTTASASPTIVVGANTQDLNLIPNSLSGQVTDSLTGLPISGATVAATDSSNVVHTVTTDGTGRYGIATLPTGPTTVTASKIGYASTNSSLSIVSGTNTQNAVLVPNVLSGVVRDTSTALPINGALVVIIDNAGVTNSITSSVDGAYSVTNIATGSASVSAGKAGYTPASTNLVIVVGANVQDLNLVPNSLSGQVTDSLTGLPISGATVSVTDSSNVVHTESTDGTGHYSVSILPTGPATVLASKTGYSSAASTPTIVIGSNTQNAVLTPNILSGVIRDTVTTLPIAGAAVIVIDSASVTNTIITGVDGTYAVTNIASGAATVSASRSGYGSAAASPTIVTGANVQDLNLTPNTLTGQVTDSFTGLPISGASVTVTDSSNVVHTVSTDGTGHYAVSNLPTGATTVAASKSGYSSASASLNMVTGANTQDEVLTPNILSGVIRDSLTALPITGATVVVIDNANVTATIPTGPDGAYAVTNIATGTASVTASKSGYNSASTNPVIVTGANVQDVNLTPTTLAGVVTDSLTGLPIDGATVSVTDSSNVVHTVSTDGTGYYSVSALPTGVTTVAASKSGYSSASPSLSLSAGANTQNVSLTPTTLSGVITDSGTHLALAGASVIVVDAAGTTNFLTADAGGYYAVTNPATGSAIVTASKSGYTPASATLTLVLGPNTQNLQLASSNPTLAVISEVKAYVSGSNVLVRWQTASEVGTVGFDLYRQSSSGWTKVNDEPVIAGNVTTGASYDVLDTAAKPQSAMQYRIVELEEQGTTRAYGPYSLNATEPLPTTSTKVAVKSAKTTSVATIQSGGSIAKVASAKSTGSPAFVKIATTNTGIQYVTAAAVATALGQTTASVQQQIAGGQFELSNQGFAVSYIPNADGSALSFYAESLKNNYTAQNIYCLTPGANAAFPSVGGAPTSSSAPATAYYNAQLDLEQDLLAVPTLVQDQAQDFWMWQRLVGGLSTFDTANIPLVLNHLSSGGDATAKVTLRLLGGSEATHVVQVSVNGTVVGQDTWDGRAAHTTVLDIPASLLVEGTNRLSLKALRKVTTVTSQWYLNNVSLEYQRQYFAQNGVLSFGANSNATITVDGFTTSAITVLDVTDAELPVFVSSITTTPSGSGYAVSFSPADPQGQFVAFQFGAGTSPAALTSAQIANLSAKQNAADYLIITPSVFADGTAQLATYRQQKGLRTVVATLDQVYNEFSDGIATPYAIKQFLATATKQWSVKPRYAILIGDGTYDYRDLLQKHDNFMPPMLVATAYGLFCSDTAYGDFNNDGLPQIAIGRLPVKTADQLATMINKIKAYEANVPAPNAQALLVSDVPDTAGDFADAIQQVNATLSGQYSNDVLKCTSQDNITDVRKSIQSNLATGVDLFNYIGHGAIDRLGNSGYITSSDIAALQTANRLPLIVAVTCVAGQFSVPGSDCLAEKLALQSNGGAVAVIAPTGLSVNHDASRLNLRLMQLLYANEGPGLGDMFRQALADHVALDKPATEPAIYNLIGDPALTYNVASKLLVTAPQITSIVAGKDTLSITWSGGSAPYHVEMRTADTTWQEVGSSTTGTTATIPINGPLGFIRIRSGQ